MIILLATNNQHKIQEICEIAPELRIVTPGELGLTFHYEETGDSFAANALGKAMALYTQAATNPEAQRIIADLRSPRETTAALADDSGICVDALDGRPGIYSARYGSEDPVQPAANDAERNERLLRELRSFDRPEQRTARYVCAAAAVLDPYRHVCIQDTLEGQIGVSPSQGQGGFGYDPIFYLPEHSCMVADIDAAEKHRISHRGKAVRRLIRTLAF